MKAPGTRLRHVGFAPLLAAVLLLASASEAQASNFADFGFESVTAELSTHVAGAHPDFRTELVPKPDPNAPPVGSDHFPAANLKDVEVALPPGIVGNLNAVEECSNADFVTATSGVGGCGFGSQVGVSEVHVLGGIGYLKSPIYKLETTDNDTVARFGFLVTTVPVFINVRLRSSSDYGVTAEVSNLAAGSPVTIVKTTLWGVPADSSHDNLRFTAREALEGKSESPPRSSGRPLEPFLSNPTSCTGPLRVGFKADSYQEPGRYVEDSAPLGEITGCEELEFEPGFTLEPTNHEAAMPSGADAELTIPQHEEWDERLTAEMRDAVVRLPEGVAVSPTAANGLASCSEQQVGYQVSPPSQANCPGASKLATVEIDAPGLSRPIKGAVYQRTPEPGHLFRAWLVADELGVHLKIPGEFQLDPLTGQVTSLFLDTPQVPLRSLKLHFFGGDRGVLATPRSCGTYQTVYSFTPWSGQEDVAGSTPMTFDQNCNAGGFAPRFEAGTSSTAAGAFTTVVTNLSQASGEQNLSWLEVKMPPGVLAKLKGVAICPEQDTAAGACPSGSEIGHSTVATGFGPAPLWIPQPGREPTAAYLAGPYQGAPLSLVVKTPAQAGPFDLGNVVVRVALQVDPTTAQVTAVSDPLPQIIQGVPISYRDVRVELDRPEFAVNPTSCDEMAASGSAASIAGQSASLGDRFQVLGCSVLGFQPKLRIALAGAMKRSGDPALSATLTMPRKKGANVAWARVTLPRGVQIDNAHINNPCTRVQFNAGACPKKSILGTATAVTPLLDKPLRGPVYFRSNGGERVLPDIVADLHGQIHVILVGYIDAKNARIRTTFANVPDAAVSRFKVKLFGGKRGLLENNRDLCKSPQRAVVQFNGQNGKISDSNRPIGLDCGSKTKPKR